jgi:L-fuconolactonase
MMRIDAHQHFWRLAARQGAWPPPDLAAIHRDFEPGDLAPLLAAHGIAGTVAVQSLPEEADTHYLLDLADRHDVIRAVVGWTDLKAPDAAERIARLASHPKLRGLRPMLQDLEDDAWIADPAVDAGARAMAEHGLAFDALVLPRQLAPLLDFARRHPQLAIVIDHLAKPAMGGAPPAQWHADLARLAGLPNVHCKLSGMVTEIGVDWTVERLRPYVRTILDLFGPERILWGSDWPVLDLAASYRAWVGASEALLAHVPAAQREAIFGLNARKFYKLR